MKGGGSNSSLTEDASLGIALIEPVICELHFNQNARVLHPTVRSINFYMKPISTMISFSDLEMIDVVLKRWKFERQLAKKQRVAGEELVQREKGKVLRRKEEELGLQKQQDEGEMSQGTLYRNHLGKIVGAEESFTVTFEKEGRLGLILRKVGRLIVVEKLRSEAAMLGICVGDWLIAVGDRSINRLTFNAVTEMLSTLPKPFNVTFGRKGLATAHPESRLSSQSGTWIESTGGASNAQFAQRDANSPKFKVSFYSTVTGLNLTTSSHGSMVIVASVDESKFSASTTASVMYNEEGAATDADATTKSNEEPRAPRPGAVVISVNGVKCNTMSASEIQRWIGGIGRANDIMLDAVREDDIVQKPDLVIE